MTREKGRRLIAAALCLCMALSLTGAAAPVSDGGEEKTSLCTHVHDETCGYAAPTAGIPCDKGCTDTDGDGIVDHVPDCAYVPASKGSPCAHVHDETCGGLSTPPGREKSGRCSP